MTQTLAQPTGRLQNGEPGSCAQPRRVKLMATLGGGGYLWEAKCLIRRLGDEFDYVFVTGDDCIVPDEFRDREVHRLQSFATIGKPHWWQTLPSLLRASVQSYRLLSHTKPDFLLCVGGPSAVPLALAARILKIRTVFVESIARFERPSVTARLMLRLHLADRFYVQWPDCVELYPGAIYRGTVL